MQMRLAVLLRQRPARARAPTMTPGARPAAAAWHAAISDAHLLAAARSLSEYIVRHARRVQDNYDDDDDSNRTSG